MTLSSLDRAGFVQSFSLSATVAARFDVYHQRLVQWQKVQNLVAPATLADVWRRHFADSAQLLPLLDGPKQLVDMGSGAGFPGLVLALLQESSDCTVHLIEANGRKCAFLKDVVRATGVNVEIHNCRIEEFANRSTIADIDVVTARALKPLPQLLDLGAFAFSNGAVGVFLKGKTYAQELQEAREAWSFEVLEVSSQTDAEGRIVKLSEVKPKV